METQQAGEDGACAEERQDTSKRARPDNSLDGADSDADAKRARSGDSLDYLAQLQDEESKILPFASVLPTCVMLLQQEIMRHGGNPATANPVARTPAAAPAVVPQPSKKQDFKPPSPQSDPGPPGAEHRAKPPSLQHSAHNPGPASTVQVEMVENQETGPGTCRTIIRVVVPVERKPGFNFIGRLLGPRGNTLKEIQSQSGCKMAIRGRGSVKLKPGETEEAMARTQQHAHLNLPLHVEVLYEGASSSKDMSLRHAQQLLEGLFVPPEEHEGDTIKKQQLRELAMLKSQQNAATGSAAQARSAMQPSYGAQNSYGAAGGMDISDPAFQQMYFTMAQQMGMGGMAQPQQPAQAPWPSQPSTSAAAAAAWPQMYYPQY